MTSRENPQTMAYRDTRIMATDAASGHPRICPSLESDGGWVELMLVAMQLSPEEAVIAIILIIALLIWALR
jgi:hypothetical protein